MVEGSGGVVWVLVVYRVGEERWMPTRFFNKYIKTKEGEILDGE